MKTQTDFSPQNVPETKMNPQELYDIFFSDVKTTSKKMSFIEKIKCKYGRLKQIMGWEKE
jgi:hypothetical protein